MQIRLLHLLGVLILLLSTSTTVQSAETDCASSRQGDWNVVQETCPIGQGLWGKAPENSSGMFWVQCGLLSSLPDSGFAQKMKGLANKEALVFRKEGSQYRCLVGPFVQYSTALSARDELRKQSALSSAFIRNALMAVNTPAKATGNPSTKMSIKGKGNGKVSAPIVALKRDYFELLGLRSPKPRDGEKRYTDDKRIWWRASLKEATSACENDRMKLVSESTLRSISMSTAHKSQLPTRLPFWVAEQHAFDSIMMVSMPLSKESALLVLCE
ncbi:SPOR domain-containing protein [Enterovibrio sp. 27052020O]|uniref:SPOR domain-containing protein n=1 Tax=Enterovibrio sp. 27052020O TaxID=3241166 RepID=UPI0038900769